MARAYSVSIDQIAVSAAQDLFGLYAGANMAFRLLRIELGQRSLTSWEAKPIKLIRMPATVTTGSGGTTPTPQKFNNGDAAATVTAHINDTVAMTTSGSASILFARTWEFLNGFFWLPTPREEIVIAPSQALAVNLPVAPSASMTVSGTIEFEEVF